jgi:hypothetical protein
VGQRRDKLQSLPHFRQGVVLSLAAGAFEGALRAREGRRELFEIEADGCVGHGPEATGQKLPLRGRIRIRFEALQCGEQGCQAVRQSSEESPPRGDLASCGRAESILSHVPRRSMSGNFGAVFGYSV